MIKIYDLNLLDLMPLNLKTDEISAVCTALDNQLKEISALIINCIILPRIDELPENVIDLLAWQLHVDFYEPLGLDLEKKKQLVKDSIIWHKQKGTKKAVEQLVKTVFFEDFKVKEWFEYGGKPYYFKIEIDGCGAKTKEEYNLLIQTINSAKNIRSHLEKLVIETNIDGGLFFGNCIAKKHNINIIQERSA